MKVPPTSFHHSFGNKRKDFRMPLGVDPRNDYAFKRMLTQDEHPEIILHLLNAVLQPPPDDRIVAVEILNPIIPLETLNEKSLVLDIKARDQSGRLFNVEMQMALHPFLANRFLLYWARMYGSQLTTGDEYDRLNPAHVICFLNAVLFPQTDACHLHFQPLDRNNQVLFSNHQHIHLFQLPQFQKTAEELEDDLEQWLYFLNNGMLLELGSLPSSLQNNPIEKAVEVLTMFTQDEIERERLESREKARRDAMAWIVHERNLKQRIEELEAQSVQFRKQQEQFDKQQEQFDKKQEQFDKKQEQLKAELARREAEAHRLEAERTQSTRAQIEALAKQIQVYQRLLKETPTALETLRSQPIDELQQQAESLQSRLLDKVDADRSS